MTEIMGNRVSRTTGEAIDVDEMSMGMASDNEVRDALGVGLYCNDRSMCMFDHNIGMDVFLLGPMPTPAVSMLTRSLRADLGVMLSASHNPSQDNGIKLFDPDGYKLSDDMERRIEDLIDADFEDLARHCRSHRPRHAS